MREWLRSDRWRSPFVVAAVAGALLLAVMMMVSAIGNRRVARIHPPGAAEPIGTGYQGLIGDLNVPIARQFVIVAAEPLEAGDRIEDAVVQRRSALLVIKDFPRLFKAAPGPKPLPGWFEQPEEAIGQYALGEIPPGMPLGPTNVGRVSPLASPLDELRPARFTIPMAAEPTLYQLLRPGDRVDIYLVSPGRVSRRAVLNVRVVAVANYVSEGSGLLSRDSEHERFGAQYEASQRSRARIRNRQAQAAQAAAEKGGAKGGAKGDASKSPEAKGDQAKSENGEEPAKSGEAASGENGKAPEAKPGGPSGYDAKNLPKGVAKAGGDFDGRAITVQVSEAEALLLSLASNTPDVNIEISLHGRS
jgi:hypothetical protein